MNTKEIREAILEPFCDWEGVVVRQRDLINLCDEVDRLREALEETRAKAKYASCFVDCDIQTLTEYFREIRDIAQEALNPKGDDYIHDTWTLPKETT